MKLRGSLLVIVCCLVVEFCSFNQKEYLILTSGDLKYTISVITTLGLLFLLYPLVGHLTDVYLTRYRSLKWSFGFLILTACMGAICVSIVIAISIIGKFRVFKPSHAYLYVLAFVVFMVTLLDKHCFRLMPFNLDWISY